MARERASVSALRTGNLPADVTSFVGRRRELGEAKSMLAQARLVTLTGVGGVGKTRLALRLAAEVRRAFPDGVWWVDLTTLTRPGLLARTVAETVEIREHSRRDPLAILADHFRDRQLLLVLDNCEHVLNECAELVDALLEVAPRLRVLATSRQGLNAFAENIMAVPPLSLPDADLRAPVHRALDDFEGVALFVERAVAVAPDFTLDEQTRPAVADICRRLDGLPLAIELAAAQVPVLSLGQIRKRLDDRYRLLTTGSQSAAPRHQTLQALIDWSFELCSKEEQLFWARISVFAGSFDLEAAEDVCRGEGIAAGDVVDLVAGLIDKSILLRELHGSVSRYQQLDTIRQYGRERLAALNEEQEVRLRHRAHYQRVAARTDLEKFGPQQVEWFGRLRLDHADLRAALQQCAADPDAGSDGLRLAADLLYHWVGSYYLNEGRAWLDELLAQDTSPTPARVDALWVDGWLALIQSDIPAAQSMLAAARSLGEQLHAGPALGYVALFSGMAAIFVEDTTAALALYEEALNRHRAAGNQHGVASTLIRSSLAYSHLGDSARAIALGEECLAVCDEAGDIWHKSYALTALGIEVWRQGDTQRANALETESLALNQGLDDRLGIALNLEVLALTAATDRQHERAARIIGALHSLRLSLGVSLSGYTHLAVYHDECVERLRSALGERDYRTLVEQGAALSFEESLDLAFQEKRDAPAAPDSGGTPQLTSREWEIAKLVAQGHSNKQIANTLVIAVRTAESHVEHILVTLGFTSRAQIARWTAERMTESGD